MNFGTFPDVNGDGGFDFLRSKQTVTFLYSNGKTYTVMNAKVAPGGSLVGGGPGDPELVALKAIRVLSEADVILYDALVNEQLLSYAKPGAVKQFVGKRYGCHALSQKEINYLIIEMAHKHGHVVRLKGGDPFVFGRAQEEIAAAMEAGIEVSVVPGISSALSVPASQMIPLTCRGVNESFWVTTGTAQSGEISPDIELAAKSSATVIILMAMSKLGAIMEIFARNGKKDTPVCIIQDGTTPKEKCVTGTANDIEFKAQHAGLTNPSIIIVGEVVSLKKTVCKISRDYNPQSIDANMLLSHQYTKA